VASSNIEFNAVNFQILFRINWAVILIMIVSISIYQFTESIAERQVSVSINNMSNITFTCSYYIIARRKGKKRKIKKLWLFFTSAFPLDKIRTERSIIIIGIVTREDL